MFNLNHDGYNVSIWETADFTKHISLIRHVNSNGTVGQAATITMVDGSPASSCGFLLIHFVHYLCRF